MVSPSPRRDVRYWLNGRASAFQAEGVGSTPTWRSKCCEQIFDFLSFTTKTPTVSTGNGRVSKADTPYIFSVASAPLVFVCFTVMVDLLQCSTSTDKRVQVPYREPLGLAVGDKADAHRLLGLKQSCHAQGDVFSTSLGASPAADTRAATKLSHDSERCTPADLTRPLLAPASVSWRG